MLYYGDDTGLPCLVADFRGKASSDTIFYLQIGKYPRSCLYIVGKAVEEQAILCFVDWGRY